MTYSRVQKVPWSEEPQDKQLWSLLPLWLSASHSLLSHEYLIEGLLNLGQTLSPLSERDLPELNLIQVNLPLGVDERSKYSAEIARVESDEVVVEAAAGSVNQQHIRSRRRVLLRLPDLDTL